MTYFEYCIISKISSLSSSYFAGFSFPFPQSCFWWRVSMLIWQRRESRSHARPYLKGSIKFWNRDSRTHKVKSSSSAGYSTLICWIGIFTETQMIVKAPIISRLLEWSTGMNEESSCQPWISPGQVATELIYNSPHLSKALAWISIPLLLLSPGSIEWFL